MKYTIRYYYQVVIIIFIFTGTLFIVVKYEYVENYVHKLIYYRKHLFIVILLHISIIINNNEGLKNTTANNDIVFSKKQIGIKLLN